MNRIQRDANVVEVQAIMTRFSDRTGLTNPDNPPLRYLWTDAHAVCNFLSLFKKSGDEKYRALALALIEQVHNVLGKHREDDTRHGWISGLSDEDGARHPTAGGLRIGKPLHERRPDEAYNDRLEWERDGQYFHYLSKWMHALYKASVVTGDVRYGQWAAELAKTAHAAFTIASASSENKRLAWKMSIDLSYASVPSAGPHDLLDGYVTYNEVGHGLGIPTEVHELPSLAAEIRETAEMIVGRQWATADPLGIGGLLFDANRIVQLIAVSRLDSPRTAESLTKDINVSIAAFLRGDSLALSAHSRLAFRELGLSIGLHAIENMQRNIECRPGKFGSELVDDLKDLNKYVPLCQVIEDFWSESANQHASTWLEHLDINEVMLATSLLPDEFLTIT